MNQFGRLDTKSLKLITQVEKHPALYNRDGTSELPRTERQKMWDTVSKMSGFEKTSDAKNRWRSLVVYLRQHMINVKKRTMRRYVPNTNNPEDKFVQLKDWRYFEYMKFLVPFITSNTITIPLIANTEEESEMQSPVQKRANTIPTKVNTLPTKPNNTNNVQPVNGPPMTGSIQMPVTTSATNSNITNKTIIDGSPAIATDDPNENASTGKRKYLFDDTRNCFIPAPEEDPQKKKVRQDIDDLNLKSFFNSMLISTQLLPLFHQKRIQNDLLNMIQKHRSDNWANSVALNGKR